MSAILVCCDKAKFRGGMYCEDHNPYPRNETAAGLIALLADKEKEIEELKHINKVAHELFASESDKLGKIVEKLETENKRLVEALETIAKMDCSSLLHACTIAQEALRER